MSTLFLLRLLLIFSSPAFTVPRNLSRHEFPDTFIFGSGTSAYQVEGAAQEDGRTPSIWDTFAHQERSHGANGDIACDQYHKYKEDVQLMVETGLEAYRFSISWSRIIPNGRGPLNPMGVAYYNNLINELVYHGIEPHVTLFHSDTPQTLEDEYKGWLSPKIVKDFTTYADACFREFGDRVLHWTTMNEGNIFFYAGYDSGITPPGRCSYPFGFFNCSEGNSSTEPYIGAHNSLLAHASAARVYKTKYWGTQHGFIGINLFCPAFIPNTNSTEDAMAARRAYDFYVGWFVHPLVFGDYPDIMKTNVGGRLPVFSEHESQLIKGAFDFVGLNHYFPVFVKDNPISLNTDFRDYDSDIAVQMIYIHGVTEKENAPSSIDGLLEHFKQVYGNPPLYIHENGQRDRRNVTLDDPHRVHYIRGYIEALLDSMRNGANVKGYFTWSFLDVFELLDFYEAGFGLYYVDLDDPDLKRYPKLSAHWYSSFLKSTTDFLPLLHNNSSSSHHHHSIITLLPGK